MAGLQDKKAVDLEIEDFIENPSNLSQKLIDILILAKNKYDIMLKNTNLFTNLKNNIKIRIWYLKKYKEIYFFVENYDILKNNTGPRPQNIISLFEEFAKIADIIALNNLLLMYSSIAEDINQQSDLIITKEDQKIHSFSQLSKGKISVSDFKEQFGHYALNAFEISSMRFSEYSESQLLKLADFTKNFNLKEGILIQDYMASINKNNKKPKRLFPIYSALREELKYNALIIIARIRLELLAMAHRKNIKDIFSLNYKELEVLINEKDR